LRALPRPQPDATSSAETVPDPNPASLHPAAGPGLTALAPPTQSGQGE
jgi:hypothetical protein